MSADLEEMLEHLKWNLWHGKVDRALEITDELSYALDALALVPRHGGGSRKESRLARIDHKPWFRTSQEDVSMDGCVDWPPDRDFFGAGGRVFASCGLRTGL